MAQQPPDDSEFETLTRTQVLLAMGITAIVLLVIAKLWMRFGQVQILPIIWSLRAVVLGLGLGTGITLASSLLYRVWSAYRRSADHYLHLVLRPLALPDLLWLGLLPGLSEELLFRGVMLPALGLNLEGLIYSSLCFGVLHLSSWKQWSYVLWATVIGGVLGLSTLLTGNLLVAIVAHVATNLISSILWKWDHLSRPERI